MNVLGECTLLFYQRTSRRPPPLDLLAHEVRVKVGDECAHFANKRFGNRVKRHFYMDITVNNRWFLVRFPMVYTLYFHF
jgi:hypothetical protein